MKRKDYLLEELSKEEKNYLKVIVQNRRKRYIRDNYNYLNANHLNILDCINIESGSVLDVILNKCEDEIKSAVEFEKIVSDKKLYNIVKALSLKEKTMLFLLYKENKSINQISSTMNISRETVWRMRNRIVDKIIKELLGGKRNV